MAAQVPATRPVRVEIRLNGTIRFADTCYDVELDKDDDAVTFSASMNPRMVDAPPEKPHERIFVNPDPRNGDTPIRQVHSGRRT